MSFQVNTTAIQQYNNNVELALQQLSPKMATYAMSQTGAGEMSEIVNLIGGVKPQIADTRHGDTKYVNTPHDRRWIAKPDEQYYADLVDTNDRLRAGIDLQGAYVQAGAATVNRAKDDSFLAGFYGTALTGKTGTTQVTFPAGNIIPVTQGAAVATGMNVAKLRAARAQLVRNLVDIENEELYVALMSQQTDNLLNEIQATSADFISKKDYTVTETGKLTKLFGFNLIECEFGNTISFNNAPLTLDGNGYRKNPFWAKSGMCVAQWGPLNNSIDRLPQKQNSVQVFSGITIGAARTQEGKCGIILSAEV